MPRLIDLTGKEFGRLTVIKRLPNHITSGGNSKVMWECECSCDKKHIPVCSGELNNHKVVSCGCYMREVATKRMYEMNKKYNEYDLSGEYGIGFDSNGNEFYFDLEDYNLIKDFCWHKHHSGYFSSHDENHKWILLHKVIMNDVDNLFDIDHIITENKFDNRKSNLRFATRSENNMNKVLQKNNTSGVAGVWIDTRDNMWRATININKQRVDIGKYSDKQDAIEVRKDAENKYYCQFSYDNSQKLKGE